MFLVGVRSGCTSAAEALLNQGADVYTPNHNNRTPVDEAKKKSMLRLLQGLCRDSEKSGRSTSRRTPSKTFFKGGRTSGKTKAKYEEGLSGSN